MPYRPRESAAIRRLRRGQVVIHATEGVFGLACRAGDREACARVAMLKKRSQRKPFIVVVADYAQINAAINLSGVAFERISADWPGPETWILPAALSAPQWLRGADCTIAVRVTAHPQLARICAAVGPLVSTSANPPGRQPAQSLLRARHYFGSTVDYYLSGALLTPGRVSRIRDGRSELPVRE